MNNKKCTKLGFTLAEVLITLVIIGVIAAFTVPNVIVKYQKQETVSRLKKVYSTLSAAMTRATTDYGFPVTWVYKNNDAASFAEKYLIPYLQILKVCGTNSTGDCAFKFSGVSNELDLSSYYKFILSDGAKIVLPTVNYESYNSEKFVYVLVDINGDKGPNRSGRDVFVFMIAIYRTALSEQEQGRLVGVYPIFDRNSSLEKCQNDVGTNFGSVNASCADLIMKDGWQIKDDYPW